MKLVVLVQASLNVNNIIDTIAIVIDFLFWDRKIEKSAK